MPWSPWPCSGWGKLTGREAFSEAAERTLSAAVPAMTSAPEAFSQMLLAVDLASGPFWELVLVGAGDDGETADVLQALRQAFLPRKVLACRTAGPPRHASSVLDPLFAGKFAAGGPALYVCEGFACQEPLAGTGPIRAWIEAQT